MKLVTLILLLAAWLIQAGHHDFKPIPDLEALGYTIQGSTPISGDFVRYDVLYGSIFLADLAIYKDNKWPGALVVFNVQTDDDTRPEALPLRDIQLGVWVYTIHRDAANLFEIKYMDVYEPQLMAVTHRVYELMSVPESRNLVQVALSFSHEIFRNYATENEGKAYDLLHDETPFGSGAQKMIDEFAEMQGKKVEAFGYEALAPGVFHFSIYF